MPGYYDYAPPYYPTIGYFATSRSSPNAPSDSSTSYQENCAKPARPPHKAYSFPTTGYYETTAYYNPYYGLPVPPPQPATLASATGVSGPRYIYPNSSHPRGRQYHQVQPHAPMPVINQALNYRLSPDTPSPSGSSYPSADDEDDKAGRKISGVIAVICHILIVPIYKQELSFKVAKRTSIEREQRKQLVGKKRGVISDSVCI